MRIKLLAFALLTALMLIVAPHASAQATGHGGTMHWTASTDAGTSVKVYRAPCTGTVTGTTSANGGILGACSVTPAASSFTVIATVASGTTNFTDTSLGFGVPVVYNLTAVCPTAGCTDGAVGESAHTTNLAAMTPPPPSSNPPTGFTLDSVQ